MKRKLLRILLGMTYLFSAINGFSQVKIIDTKLLVQRVKEYQKAEWDIRIKGDFKNPFNQHEVALDMLLTSPSGKPLLLPCYFVKQGNKVTFWKARFSPQEQGIYTYYFRVSTAKAVDFTDTTHFNALANSGSGFLHKNNLWTFKFDNGKVFRGIGENVAWESRSFENSKWTYNYLLPKLAIHGATFFRTWMCWWNLPLEWNQVSSTKRYQSTKQFYNPNGIKRMDELVEMIDSLGLYMMLTLDMNKGNWVHNPYNRVNGGPISQWKDFFTSRRAMDRYKDKLRYVVARWGYSTHIAAWEFFNEIDNGIYTPQDSVIIPHSVVTQWHIEMSRYLKDIDPYQHLVTTSISHRDIQGLNSIPYIDFNQKHIYKHTEKIPSIYPDYIQTFGKPYVIGEFGYRWEDGNPKYAKEFKYDFKRGLWYGLFSPTPILPMSWWWELFDDLNLEPYFKSVQMINQDMLCSGEGSFNLLKADAGILHVQAVQCGEKVYIYLLNESNQNFGGSLKINIGLNKTNYSIQRFNPDNRSYYPIKFNMTFHTIKLNDFQLNSHQSSILILSPTSGL